MTARREDTTHPQVTRRQPALARVPVATLRSLRAPGLAYTTRVRINPRRDGAWHAATGLVEVGHARRTACGKTFLHPAAEHPPHALEPTCRACLHALEDTA